MNNKAKKLISGVLALSIVFSGNGIVGFADEADTKSTEQSTNSEATETGVNLEQDVVTKEQAPTPNTEEAKPEAPAAKEFRPEELTFSGKSVCNPYLEQAVKDLNEFIKEYNSKATREEKRAFAKQMWEKLYDILRPLYAKKIITGSDKEHAEYFKSIYIHCCLTENPYLADAVKEFSEIQKIYDSKERNLEKLLFVEEEANKCRKQEKIFEKMQSCGITCNSGEEENLAGYYINHVKFIYLICLGDAKLTRCELKLWCAGIALGVSVGALATFPFIARAKFLEGVVVSASAVAKWLGIRALSVFTVVSGAFTGGFLGWRLVPAYIACAKSNIKKSAKQT